MSITEEYNIKKILFNTYNYLGKLCHFSKKQNDINVIVHKAIQQLHSELSPFCQVNHYKDNCLTIETSRAEFLTVLKFNSTQLITTLRQYPELANLITIKYKVNPELQHIKLPTISSKPISDNKPSQNAKQKLRGIADQINNQQLKNALLKLSDDK